MRRDSFSFKGAEDRTPTAEHYYKIHSEVNDISYTDAYNEVLRVMRTFQHMLISYTYFTMPGIGLVGLARYPKKGLMVASVQKWWAPGILTVLSANPGWENAPLNGYLTPEHVKKINRIISRISEGKRSIPTHGHFYRNSDLGVPGETLEDLELVTMAEKTERFHLSNSENGKNRQLYRTAQNNYVRKGLATKIMELEEALGLPHTDYNTLLKEEYDKIQKSGSPEL